MEDMGTSEDTEEDEEIIEAVNDKPDMGEYRKPSVSYARTLLLEAQTRHEENAKAGLATAHGESYKDIKGYQDFIKRFEPVFKHRVTPSSGIKYEPVQVVINNSIPPPRSHRVSPRPTPAHWSSTGKSIISHLLKEGISPPTNPNTPPSPYLPPVILSKNRGINASL